MRNDKVEAVVDLGNGLSKTYLIEATKNGRTVEVTHARGMVHVVEMTHTGKAIRTAQFPLARVIALVEIPAGDTTPGEQPDRRADPAQPSLLDPAA